MKSVSESFAHLRQTGQCALIPFITAGDPDLKTTAEALRVLDRSGADIIELGVPYSDPLADGPAIQAAATRALKQGVRLDDVLDIVRTVGPEISAPIVLFTYYNPILHRGIEAFLKSIAEAGVKGLVVPDLPLEESQFLIDCAETVGVEVVLLIAPTSPKERILAIAEKSQGFIYLVSVTGVTGTRTQVSDRVKELIPQLRAITDKPIGVGFGISEPEHARQMKDWGADAAICGSAFVKRLSQGTTAEGLAQVEQFCQELKQAIS
ncbi:MAG: tryptophan synthase subunit alpha [Sodalinema sp.]|uniref:tryptophan synthase subunit alpha n=1 Tax=Sodalinema sp. TaxID=3080550 RepID=UPI001204CF49|nr:MAG: tryptophan synthase subunit alpha [Phormidium sp. SL48-SHIP]